MAKSAQPPARARPPVRPPSPVAATARRGSWSRSAGLLFALIVLAGIVPVALAGDLLGWWTLSRSAPFIVPRAAPTPTYTPLLATPERAWIATPADVLPRPGGGGAVARLWPGFPVALTQRARLDAAPWARITWNGPTPRAGGMGWVVATALVAYGADGRALGDAGALSPALGQALAPYGPHLAAVIYFPDLNQFYLTANADQSFALGDGFRAVLLAALLASARANAPPATGTAPAIDLTSAAALASGNSAAAATAYTRLGGADGISRFLRGQGISGIQPDAATWDAAQATPRALIQFYTALLVRGALSDADRVTAVGLLARGGSGVAPASAVGVGGVLVGGSAQGQGGWSASACGVLAPNVGQRAVVVAVALREPSAAAAQDALRAFYAALAPLLME
ncbi:MAG: hypothetical protein IVW57_12240 [Ktedonobacterales bacterium]|nr:hypothetical protein [Ktedonobacterales bacterium]